VKIGKRNRRRLASLSALGAGALALNSGTAQAGSIVYSGTLDEQVGFSKGFLKEATFVGPDGAGAMLERHKYPDGPFFSRSVGVFGVRGAAGTQFRFLAAKGTFSLFSQSFARAFPTGVEWGTAERFQTRPGGGGGQRVCAGGPRAADGIGMGNGIAARGPVVATLTSCFVSSQATHFNRTDRYLLFEFSGGALARPLYGWAQLDVMFGGALQHPDVTLVDWAYDTSGAQIPAGDTGTPEPSTFVLTGLAAMALGAKGLRKWRQARGKAAGQITPFPL
jgi:hypothetical protein